MTSASWLEVFLVCCCRSRVQGPIAIKWEKVKEFNPSYRTRDLEKVVWFLYYGNLN